MNQDRWLTLPLLLMGAVLLLAACGAAAPTATGSKPVATAPATVTPAPNVTTAPAPTPITGLSAACGPETMDNSVLANPEAGYCLRYPANFKPQIGDAPDRPAGTWVVSFFDPSDADRIVSLAIETSLANGRTLEQVVTEELGNYSAEITAQIMRTPTQLGGEPAVILDGLPGILMNRQAFVIHGDRLHRLVLLPWHEEAFGDRQAEAQALWDQIVNSLAFMRALMHSSWRSISAGI